MLAKKFALAFGIAILFPMMIHLGVKTFYGAPRWEVFHRGGYYSTAIKRPGETPQQQVERQRLGQEYRSQLRVFHRELFCTALPAGITAVIIGSLLGVQAVGTGLMFGGIISLLEAYTVYWQELDDLFKFVSILISLIILIGVGYLKLTDMGKSSNPEENSVSSEIAAES